jgi:hypothetical protein
MPYYITDSAEGCSGWATIKEDGEVMGCHETKDDAIDQALAIAAQEGSEFLGERAMPGTLKPGDFVSWKDHGETFQGRIREVVTSGFVDVPGSGVQIEATYFDPAALVQMYEQVDGQWQEASTFLGLKFSQLSRVTALIDDTMPEFSYDEPNMDDSSDQTNDASYSIEQREVDLSAPAFMRAAARQGLKYHEEGYSGDGLRPATVREARAMAAGNVTADKWVRIAAWIARHLGDLDSPAAKPGNEDYPSAGVVAHLLWGSGPSKRAANRALRYAQRVVARLEEENRALVSVEARDMAKIETRVNSTQFELRDSDGGDGMTFTGYAAVWDSPSLPLPFTETIQRGAFSKSLQSRNDIKLLWNHDSGTVLGSTRAGTLRLHEDEIGLRVEADLPPTSDGKNASILLKRGDIDSMSFGFSVPPGGDEWVSPNERVLKSVRLFEASIVAMPAYPGTAGHTSVRAIDKICERASVDPDALADAMLKIEQGQDLTEEEAGILSKVIDTLGPKAEEPENTEEVEANEELSAELLEIKKKKLETLLKGI